MAQAQKEYENLKVGEKNWRAAKKWATAATPGLHLRHDDISPHALVVTDGSRSLVFNLGGYANFDPEDWYLEAIQFSAGRGNLILWHRIRRVPHPPKSLDELLDVGEGSGNQRFVRNAAELHPAFGEAYEGIYRRLFPNIGHHEIHRDISGWEEMLCRDTALIRRLRG